MDTYFKWNRKIYISILLLWIKQSENRAWHFIHSVSKGIQIISGDSLTETSSHYVIFYDFTFIYSVFKTKRLLWRPIKETLANRIDPDQTPQYAASDQGLHCLH